MTIAIINKWDGGQAEDVRTTEAAKSEFSQNFNNFTEPYRLNPYSDSIADTADVAIDDSEISDVGICAIAGTDYIVGLGYASNVSQALSFYTKTSVTAQFEKQASATGNSFVKGSGVTYKKLAFGIDSNGSGTYRLIRFDSAGSTTTIGSISATSGMPAKCFVHPEDNILYVVIENVIAKWDGSGFSTHTTILPSSYTCASLTNYSGYLAIAMNAQSGNRNPVCLLWGRDTTINTLQGSLDLGEGYVGVVENLNNNLFFVMSPYMGFATNNQNKIMVKGYAGGSVETITEINDSSALSIGQVTTFKAKKNNRVYFGFNNSDCVWTFGKNKDGRYAITQDRYVTNGTQIADSPATQSIQGISIVGDVIWLGGFNQTGTYTLMRSRIVSGEGLAYTATSKYRTSVNPNMTIADRYREKTLTGIQISFTGLPTGITVKYSIDGGSFITVITSAIAVTGEYVLEATSQTTSEPFGTGREIRFQIESTGGVKPKELRYSYDVTDTTLN